MAASAQGAKARNAAVNKINDFRMIISFPVLFPAFFSALIIAESYAFILNNDNIMPARKQIKNLKKKESLGFLFYFMKY